MPVIPFPQFASDEAFDDFLDSIPDVEDMDAETLKEYQIKLTDAIHALDAMEPKNEESEAYEDWADKHEDLEDILDEILDQMDDQ